MTATNMDEKESIDHREAPIEQQDEDALSPFARTELVAFDRKMLLKLDFVLIPLVASVYLLSYVDRANIGNARVAGLQKDLKLSDHQYQTAITCTYVLYICAELPSNLLLKKIGPRIVIPLLCLCWGIVTTLQSQVNSYGGLIAVRLILGLTEGGLFPGMVLYLSMFYRRKELQVRIALFYSASALAGAFSGLLAAAVSKMDGIRGMRGWQWIFCLEGLFTVCFAFFAYWAMPNSPGQVKTFTAEQAARCEERLKLEASFPAEPLDTAKVLSVFKSPHLLLIFVIMFCGGVLIFSLSYWTPSIVASLGYSSTRAQLMTVPPFAIAFVVAIAAAFLADHFERRGIASIATLGLALTGIVMFYKGRSISVRYAALCFLITGVYSNGPCLLAWVGNNAAAHNRRAISIAVSIICSNSGGIVSTWIFPRKDAPYYLFATKFILAMVIISTVAIAAEIMLLRHLNMQKETPEVREQLLRPVLGLEFSEQIVILGDRHPDFKYIL